MAIRVIIMDIDGTLVNSERKLSDKNRDALLKAQECGAILVLASGRPTVGLLDLARQLEMDKHHGLLVSYNGSRVVDCETMEVLFDRPMTIEEGKAVLEHIKKFDRVRPIVDKGEYMVVTDVYDSDIDFNGKRFNVIAYEARGNHYKLYEVDDMVTFADFPINKILTFSDPEYLQTHYVAMMEPFKDCLSCMFTSPFYFEYTAKGIDKAKALEEVLLPMGYKIEEMIAFGDGHNDESMVRFAGIGIAMENAVQELKDMANDVTLSNDEDGVAHSLYKYMPEILYV